MRNVVVSEGSNEKTIYWRLILDGDGDPEVQVSQNNKDWTPALCLSPECGIVKFNLEGVLNETPFSKYIDEDSGEFVIAEG